MDYLNIAKAHLDRATNIIDLVENMDPLVATGLSIAAALIALVEQRPIEAELCESKPRFVQVGDRRFNLDAITQIETFNTSLEGGGRGITIYLESGPAAQLRGEDMACFLLWHEQHADVVRLDVAEGETE